jgi:hypothetical protein
MILSQFRPLRFSSILQVTDSNISSPYNFYMYFQHHLSERTSSPSTVLMTLNSTRRMYNTLTAILLNPKAFMNIVLETLYLTFFFRIKGHCFELIENSTVFQWIHDPLFPYFHHEAHYYVLFCSQIFKLWNISKLLIIHSYIITLVQILGFWKCGLFSLHVNK